MNQPRLVRYGAEQLYPSLGRRVNFSHVHVHGRRRLHDKTINSSAIAVAPWLRLKYLAGKELHRAWPIFAISANSKKGTRPKAEFKRSFSSVSVVIVYPMATRLSVC